MYRKPLLFILLALSLLPSCTPTSGQFRTPRAAQEPPGAMSRQPATVAFLELDANPALYQNTLVRVSGAFAPLPEPPCRPMKGPPVDWSLIDQELRLDVQGFERVIELVPPDTRVTVDGFWQRYEGPVGCGKEPQTRILWYLRAVRLVQPNPLPELAAVPEEPTAPGEEPTPTGDETPTPSATPSPTRQTPTPDLTASPEPTLEATPTEDPEATPTIGTPSPTPEEESEGEETPEATPTVMPTPDDEGATPPGATPTPSDYPAPPTPTPTEEGYPGR